MSVKIGEITNGSATVTVDESESVFGKLFDGMLAPFGSDYYTSSEVLWGTVGWVVTTAVLSSMQARKNAENNIKPLLGLFF